MYLALSIKAENMLLCDQQFYSRYTFSRYAYIYSLKGMYKNILCNTNCNGPILETTQISVSNEIYKYIVVYLCNGILYNKNKWVIVLHNNINEYHQNHDK